MYVCENYNFKMCEAERRTWEESEGDDWIKMMEIQLSCIQFSKKKYKTKFLKSSVSWLACVIKGDFFKTQTPKEICFDCQ